jgi:hypothetical protein
MGYILVNLTKKEFIDPQHLGDKYNPKQFLEKGSTLGQALLLLVTSQPEKRGYGDLRLTDPLRPVIGRWAGDEVILIGEYAKDDDYSPRGGARLSQIQQECREGLFNNIIYLVREGLEDLEKQV